MQQHKSLENLNIYFFNNLVQNNITNKEIINIQIGRLFVIISKFTY